jgi:hypothetical protein
MGFAALYPSYELAIAEDAIQLVIAESIERRAP